MGLGRFVGDRCMASRALRKPAHFPSAFVELPVTVHGLPVAIETGHGGLKVNVRRDAFMYRSKEFSTGTASMTNGACVLHRRSAEKTVTRNESAAHSLGYVDVAISAACMTGVAIMIAHGLQPGIVFQPRSHFKGFVLTSQSEVNTRRVKLYDVGMAAPADRLWILHVRMRENSVDLRRIATVAAHTAQGSVNGFGEAFLHKGVQKGLPGGSSRAASTNVHV
jgi:hypothetical protein